MKLPRLVSATGFALAALVVAGCSSKVASLPVANVSGDVTFEGKPLAKGTISFATDGRSPQVFDIRDGKYSGAAMIGPNQIQISSKKPAAAGAKDPSGGRMQASGGTAEQEAIPATYNSASKETRVVEAGGANKFDFDIKGK